MKYNVSAIKEIVDIETVCEWLNIPIKYEHKNTYILCPAHNDKNFGSCYLKENNRFVCYSCGTEGDVIDLVEYAKHCDFTEACNYLAKCLGGEIEWDKSHFRKKVLDEESLITLFMPKARTPLKVSTGILSESDFFFAEKDVKAKWIPYLEPEGSADIGYYIVQEKISHDPLSDLLNSDEKAYNALICDKAKEAKEKWQKILLLTKTSIDGEKDLTVCINSIIEHIGYSEFTKYINKQIKRCDEIRIEHSLKNPLTSEKETSNSLAQSKIRVFGKVRSGISF
ncbi:MAG: hypothetical protein IJ341_02930 [Bacteroidales bacterium]|nr:hypothetical protein [Bacteroidales bacterium]